MRLHKKLTKIKIKCAVVVGMALSTSAAAI